MYIQAIYGKMLITMKRRLDVWAEMLKEDIQKDIKELGEDEYLMEHVKVIKNYKYQYDFNKLIQETYG